MIISAAHRGHFEVVQTLAFLMENPNASYIPEKNNKEDDSFYARNRLTGRWKSPGIYAAAYAACCDDCGRIFVTKYAFYTHMSDKHMLTPIYMASRKGHLEIIKFLASISDNFTSRDKVYERVAQSYKHNHVVKYFKTYFL